MADLLFIACLSEVALMSTQYFGPSPLLPKMNVAFAPYHLDLQSTLYLFMRQGGYRHLINILTSVSSSFKAIEENLS